MAKTLEEIKIEKNVMPRGEGREDLLMSEEEVKKARAFHKSFPQYERTPLAELKGMSGYLGLKDFFVKDESYRFGLNAFKVLGGSYAMGRYIAEQLGRDISEVDYSYLTSDKLKEEFGTATFYTATDGNHGRGVAWAANQLGQHSVVHMPKGSSLTRLHNIQKEGAKAQIEEVNYDDCVRIANAEAEADDKGVMVQDTAWEGYEKIPTWIMQGYGTMAMEALEQMREVGVERPTHIFVQAGVGSLAGAVTGFFSNVYEDDKPVITIVEASEAACLYKSAKGEDGKIRFVTGDMPTIMAGLACGEPNTISWEILRNNADFFVSAPDWVSAEGMRMLAAPVKGDPQVISGESGAVAMGLIATLMKDEAYQDMKEAIGLDENSKVLMFSTEGDTDPDNWRAIVWGGKYPTFDR